MKPTINRLFNIVALLAICLMLGACNKNVLYQRYETVSGTSSAEILPDSSARRPEKILAPDDKLTLSIWGHDDLSVGSIHTIYNVQEEQGKWLMVDADGEVMLPQVGKLKLQGLTIPQATRAVQQQYAKTIKDPQVTLRLLNNQVTILGEVQRAGVYIFTTDNVRLVDVLAKASGLTDYAKTTTIRIVRQHAVFEADLTNAAFNTTVVLPGDVIYVPPSSRKGFDRFANKMIPLASFLTALALIYSISLANDND
jgi:polysaccharide export outer membrane protein